jgi:hypothetical protein
MTTDRYPTQVEIAKLVERTSARGTRYMTGLLGLGRVILLPDAPAADGTPTWRLLIGGRSPAADRATAPSNADPPAAARPATRPAPRARRPRPQPARPDDGAPMANDSVADLWQGGSRE